MFATLNLQLTPTPAPQDSQGVLTTAPVATAEGGLTFTDLLRSRVDSSLANGRPGGEFLPQGGKPLPPQSPIAVSVEPLPPAIDSIVDDAAILSAQIDATPFGGAETADSGPQPGSVGEFASLTPTIVNEVVTASVVRTTGATTLSDEASPVSAATLVPPTGDSLELERADIVPTDQRIGDRPLSEVKSPTLLPQPSLMIRPDVVATPAELSSRLLLPAAGVETRSLSQPVTARRERAPLLPTSPAIAATPLSNGAPSAATTAATTAVSGAALDAVPQELQPARVSEGLPLIRPSTVLDSTPQQERAAPLPLSTSQLISQPIATFSAGPQVTVDQAYSAAAAQATQTINTPVTEAGWGERISERVLLMANGQLKTAEIRLTPAELGPVRIQLSMDDGAANVSFHAQHAVTRDLLEQSLPRLREMLAENGLSLGQADVGEQGVAEGNRERRATDESASTSADGMETEHADDATAARQKAVTSDSLVDTFV